LKLLVSIALALLVLIGGGSGYCIWKMREQIDDLELDISRSLDEVSEDFNAQLQSRNQSLTSMINEQQLALAEYTDSTERLLSDIKENIWDNFSALRDLTSRDSNIENTLYSSVLPAWNFFDTARKSVVRISDGENVLGSGFLYSIPQQKPSDINMLRQEIITSWSIVENHGARPAYGVPFNARAYVHDLYVTLWDGSTYEVDVHSFSKELDLAILTIHFNIESFPDHRPPKFTTVQFADSDRVKPGDPVFIVSSLNGLEKEFITTGVVSGISRYVKIEDRYIPNLIQFDAAVNFGGLGSPVFSFSGDVIGITMARINPLAGENIGFAIPSNLLDKIEVLMGKNSISTTDYIYNYPWIGITAEDMNPKDIIIDNNTTVLGVEVTRVSGPAARAGIMAGDIIVKMDNTPIFNCEQFFSHLSKFYVPGDEIELELRRQGEILEITLKVEQYPD
jgi:S1-C subfamily serine protease